MKRGRGGWKKVKKVIALLMVCCMVLTTLPMEALAAELRAGLEDEALLRETLQQAVDEAEYPNGVFEFLTTKMSTSEDLSFVEFAIVRKGGTLGEASVTFKAVDISAKYGLDYSISVPLGRKQQELPENPEAKPLIESFPQVDDTVISSVYGTISIDEEVNIADDTVISSVYDARSDYLELAAPVQEEKSGLRAARDAFTGTTSQRTNNWREPNEEEQAAALAAQRELYEELPGVTYRFEFAEGEYMKKLRFHTIDDDISEDEEQVLLLLLDMAGGTLGENTAGYMNIVDNDVKEPVIFELEKKQISVQRPADSVDVAVRRTSGINRYGSVTLGTVALSAEADIDYQPVLEELMFVPGQETKTVSIPLMAEETGDERQFLVRLDSENADSIAGGNTQTVIAIEASQSPMMSRLSEPFMLAESDLLEASSERDVITKNGNTYIVKTLKPEDLEPSEHVTIGSDGLASVSVNAWDFRAMKHSDNYTNYMSFPADLSTADYVSVKWKLESWERSYNYFARYRANAVLGAGDYHVDNIESGDRHDFWFRQYPGYDILQTSERSLGEAAMQPIHLSDRTKNKLYLAVEPKYIFSDINATLSVEWVKLYERAYTIVLKNMEEAEDPDSGVVPRTWTAKNQSKAGSYIYIGSLTFGDAVGESRRAYSAKDTVYFAPKFADGLSQDVMQKVYLWGYKIERKGTGGFYKIEGESLNMNDLRTNKLKDVDGKTVLFSEVLMSGDQIGIVPIYKAKNAYVKLEYDTNKGETIGNTFPGNTVMHIGMLDSLDFRVVGKGSNAVAGVSALHSYGTLNYTNIVPVERINPRSLFQGWLPTNAHERRMQNFDNNSEINLALNNLSDPYVSFYAEQANHIGVNPAVPGELMFTPQKTLTTITMLFDDKRLTAKVYPNSPAQDMGTVAYIPKEGDIVPGDKDRPIILSPVYTNQVYSFTGIPADGYRIVWQDYSGDLDGNGDLSREEKNNLRAYEHSFSRVPVVGNSFNYISKYDHPLIYYFFERKSESALPVEVHGTVTLRTRDIISPENYKEVNLSNASVNVNGHTTVTDKDGYFSIKHTDFEIGKHYNILITYNGVSYSGYIKSYDDTYFVIDEYGNFTPYDFKVNGKSDTSRIDNSKTDYQFTFMVNANTQGLSPAKAWIRIYSKEGILRGMPFEVRPANGIFSFTFNPDENGVLPGDRMTMQIEDQYGNRYMEHKVGFDFKRKLDTFSLLNSFKTPAKPVIDFVGTVDAAFDLGLAGKLSDYSKETKEGFLIAFGFTKEWQDSLEDEGKVKDEDGTAADEIKESAKDGDKDKTDETSKKAVDKDGPNKKATKITSDWEVGISTALYLRMKFHEGDYYFEEMFMTATLDGTYKKTAERPTPIGITLFIELELKGEITATMVIEQYQGKKRFFNGEGEIDFSKADDDDLERDFTIYGSLFVKPTIEISAGAKVGGGASVTVSGKAAFDFRFYTSGKGTGDVKLTAKLTLQILFYEYTWEIAQKSYSLFGYGRSSISDMLGDSEFLYQDAQAYNISSRDYLRERGLWQPNDGALLRGGLTTPPFNEQILSQGAYPYPYTLLATIGDDSQLLVFLDDSGIEEYSNSIQLYYSIYDSSRWTAPQKVDDDDTTDGLPWLCDLGDKVVLTWSSADSQIEAGDSVLDTLNNQDIKTRFFNKATKEFGEVQNVTHKTVGDTDAAPDYYADTEPYVVYTQDAAGKDRLMIVYKKTEYKAIDDSEVLGDILNPYYSTLAYRFYDFENECWDEVTPTTGLYDQGFIDVSTYVKADGDFIDSATGIWMREPVTSEVALTPLPYSDPYITDYNAVGYENFAAMAYAIDMDGQTNTTADQELFIQLYDFDEQIFYPAIRITDNDSRLYNLVFAEFNDTLYLFFGENGEIQSFDVGYLIREALLEFTVAEDGKGSVPVMVWNKANGAYRGPELAVRPENGANEFMVKADADNLYVLWGETDVVTVEGIDPNSDEAALAENQIKEKHIYAARLTLADEATETFYEEDGTTPLVYPDKDESGNTIDYNKVKDINGTSGYVEAGDVIEKTYRPADWSNPIQVTESTGANYNDIDFEILPNGSLRAVYVKGPSTYKEVADPDSGLLGQIVMEDIDARVLMTADYDVNRMRAGLKMSPIEMPQPNGIVPVKVSVENLALSALNPLSMQIYQVTDNGEDSIAGFQLSLVGGEHSSFTYLWEAPDNLTGIRLRAELLYEDTVLATAEQEVPVGSVIDINDAKAELVDRSTVRIFGKAVNEGNLRAENAEIKVEAGGELMYSFMLDSLDIGEEYVFEIEFKLTDTMKDKFKSVTNEDGSVTETLSLSVNSESGTGSVVSCERSASAASMDIMKNILDFSLMSGGRELPAQVNLYAGGTMIVEPTFSYKDAAIGQASLVYVSSDDSVADIYDGELTGLKNGKATITVYALPPTSGLIMKASGFQRINSLATIAEEAVRQRSFTVQVGGSTTPTSPEDQEDDNATPPGRNDTTQNSVVNGVITVHAKLEDSGNASATVTGGQIAAALEQQQDDGVKLTIQVEALAQAGSVDTVLLPEALAEMKAAQVRQLTIVTPIATVMFDDRTLEGLLADTSDDLTLDISRMDTSALSADVQQQVGNRPVFDFTVSRGGKDVEQFSGNVTVGIPYTPEDGEDLNSIIICYINEEGRLEIVKSCSYDSASGMIWFTTNHFSMYAVGYNPVSFSDVTAESWHYKAITFIAAREITYGTGEGNYSPNIPLTRAQLLVLLMRAYDVLPDENPVDNFIDAGNTYYTGYLATAKRFGITKGVGDNQFAPESQISRQEMFTLLYNTFQFVNQLPNGDYGKKITEFTDFEQIDSWATEALTFMVETGTVVGNNDALHPKNTATRAEMAQVLYNLFSGKHRLQ